MLAGLLPAERRAVAVIALIAMCRMFGLFALLPVLAIFAAGMHGATPTLIGLAVGAYGLTQAALQIPLGALSDRLGRIPVILLGLCGSANGDDLRMRGRVSILNGAVQPGANNLVILDHHGADRNFSN